MAIRWIEKSKKRQRSGHLAATSDRKEAAIKR